MKLVFIVFIAILALNALVILAVAGILLVDHARSRRKGANHDEPAQVS